MDGSAPIERKDDPPSEGADDAERLPFEREDWVEQHPKRGFHALLRTHRVQLGIGFFLSVLTPYITRIVIDGPREAVSSSSVNTLVMTAAAVLFGYRMFRRLTRYPGVMAASYILPSLVVAFMGVFAVVLFGRLDYSRAYLAASFLVAVFWFHLIHFWAARRNVPHFLLLPFGDATSLRNLPQARWTDARTPGVKRSKLSGIVADLRAEIPPRWQAFLADSAITGTPVYHIKQVREALTGRVEIEHLSENNLGSLMPNGLWMNTKRVLDLLAAVLLSPLWVTLWGLTALAVRLDSPGPVLFKQRRMGFGGRPFTVLKFRTMTHREVNEDREEAVTREADPRITRVGSFLRRTRLDELPQVVNVLRGEMSWIGPRPEAMPLSSYYQDELPFYRYRHIVRPGITGWAQVNQGHVASLDAVTEKLHYDFYYIKHFSAWLDILIAMRTVRVVLMGVGAR